MRRVFPFLALVPLVACTSEDGSPSEGVEAAHAAAEEASTVDPAVTALRDHCAELAQTPEKEGVTAVTVQHLLVSFGGTGTRATRPRDEAERLAAELWQRIQDGEDFDQLVRDHTDDSAPGIYKMVVSGGRPPATFDRTGMVAAFGDVGWRLDVGEFGVAPFSAGKSPYGWHIIKRTE